MIIPKSQFSRSYHAFLSRLEKSSVHLVFFFNDPATTEIYTLSLHDALPIPVDSSDELGQLARTFNDMQRRLAELRSEEHTSELQSHSDLVCRLLLEKKK